MDFEALRKPFPPETIHWRIGATTQDKSKGMALAYIDARDVMDRLDAVCTPGGWQCRYTHAQGTVVCEIGIWAGVPMKDIVGEEMRQPQWLWKADGAGATDVEAEKGSLSDAFKRAAVRWGIGRYLYDLPSPWVALEQKGRSHVIAQSEYTRLRDLLGGNGSATNGKAKAAPPAEQSETARLAAAVPQYLAKIANAKTLDAIEHLQSVNGKLLAAAKKRPALHKQIVDATNKRIEEVATFSERADREIGPLESEPLTPETPF